MNSQESHASSSSSSATKRRRSDEPVAVPVPEHVYGDQVLADIGRLCMNELYSDVEFLVEDQRLPAHRLILAVRSEYFRALLYGVWSESKERQIRMEAPLAGFKIILGYLYQGTLTMSTMDVDAIFELLVLANMYGLLEAETAIAKQLGDKLAIDNVYTILDTARLLHLAELTMKCFDFIDKNARRLLEHDSFQMLTKESLEEVLRRDTFCAFELEIFQAVRKWSRHNPSVDFKSVLPLVRRCLFSFNDLVSEVFSSGIFKLFEKWKSNPILQPYRAAVRPGVDVLPEEGWKIRRVGMCESIMELGFWFIINNIKIFYKNCLDRSLNCSVEISCNREHSMGGWVAVGNIRLTSSQPIQEIRFTRRPVRYIRVVHPASGRKHIIKKLDLQAFLNDNIEI